MSSQIMHYGLILTIILVGINASLIVGSGLVNADNDFSSSTLIAPDFGITDPNSINPNEIQLIDVQSEENPNAIAAFFGDFIQAIPFIGDVVTWLGNVKNLVVNLLFGYVTLFSLIGLPDIMIYVIAAPLFAIQIITLLWLLITAVGSLKGGKI